MKLIFTYDQNKDAECLLNWGKGSANSSKSTKVYDLLLHQTNGMPTLINTIEFIKMYILSNKIDIRDCILKYQSEWDKISKEFEKRTMSVFGISLPNDITVYLSINNRRPYSIDGNYFYITMPLTSAIPIIMHELWHFYTWYRFGDIGENNQKISMYNEKKEALTVLLNNICYDLFPPGVQDSGYSRHLTMRNKAEKLWVKHKDIEVVWNKMAE